jgi:hypothetical protein
MGFLALPDEHFWADPLEHQVEVSLDLVRSKALGVLLDGPGRVDLSRRGSLPLVVAQVATFADFDRADVGRHGVLSAVEVESGQAHAAPLQDQDMAPAGPAGQATPPKKGVGAQMWFAQARTRLGLPWSAGRWLLTVHVGDRASGRLEVLLERPVAPADAAAVAELLVEERRRRLQAWPEAALRGEDDAAAPPPPEQPGVALELDRVTVLRAGAPVAARVSFRLPAGPQDRPLEGAEVPDAPGARAVLPVTLLVIGTQLVEPRLFPLRLPSTDDPAASDGLVTGRAVVDLRRLPGFVGKPQTYHAWALAGEQLAGPVAFTLLSEEQVLDR